MGKFHERKAQLLEAIHAISDEKDLAEWEDVYRKVRERRERIQQYRATSKEKFDLEGVRRNRGYHKPDNTKVMRLIQQMDVQATQFPGRENARRSVYRKSNKAGFSILELF